MSKNHYRLFFSWQSDELKSRKLLETALQNAKESLKDDYGLELEIDHSTLGESGMASVDQTVLRKIDACDIFLADVTPVATYYQKLGNGQDVKKECPNANVLLELGYAMSALGVGYVIPVVHQGTWIPANLPFDINHHTINSFTSSNCDLAPLILDVLKFIKKNGRHRHLDKPYFIYLLQRYVGKLLPRKSYKKPNDISYSESIVFFRSRIASSFPGDRGLVEFTKTRDIRRHLSKLFEKPLHFRKSMIGAVDPVWYFRGHNALDIGSFKWIGGRRCLMGWDELKIKRIVAFLDSGLYYANYVYVEAEAQKPTGLYKHLTPERIEELKKDLGGYVDEEYGVYKPYPFYWKKITKQEEDDGSTKIFGKLVIMDKDKVESRCRFLTDYNFIIAAKGSPFNCQAFDRTSEPYFRGLLEKTVTDEEFNEYLLRFPKKERDL